MKLKKLFLIIFSLCLTLCLACGLAACKEDGDNAAIPVASIGLDKTSLELEEGDTCRLIATVLPSNADDKTIIWTSDNTDVATVVDGLVTARAEGTATVTAKAGGFEAVCTVKVSKKAQSKIPVTSVTLNYTSYGLKAGENFTLSTIVLPANATDREVKWTSSNEQVAVVVNGKVTAKVEGTATITATADGKSATCSVTVTKAALETVSVEEVVLDRSSLSLKIDETQTITATIKPTDSTVREVNWSSSNEKVAVVVNGKVTAKGEGTATITATADGKSASCSVTVAKAEPEIIPVSGITLNSEKLELEVGEKFTLTATVSPSNATDKTVVWNSESQVTATVEDGLVTAKAVGETIISATAGDVTVECALTVKAKEETPPVDPDQPITNSIITYAHAGEECAAFEWNDTDPSKAKVEYKLSSAGSYTQVDSQLVRQISSSTVRADILGLKGGAKYDFKITSGDGKSATVTGVEISSYDRSGYAHHNYTGGVGGYNDDGTLKSNAKVIYVTEQNKNDIDGKGTSIAEYLAKTQKTPVVVRIIGTVGAATWKEGNVTYTKTSGNTDSGGNLLPEAIIGANGTALKKQDWTQAQLIDGGYNVLDTSKFSELEGLSSTIKWDGSKNEFDSCWNDCQVKVSNITIEGVGEGAEIFQFGFTFKSCNSVEVRNLRFYDYTEDACSIEGSDNSETLSGFTNKNFWIHHNTFDIGVNYWDVCKEQDKHDGDGSTDIKRVSYVTFAYNVYHNTHKTGLVGSDDTVYTAAVTFHHNYYNECKARLPLARQANMHMYNNYYYNTTGTSFSLRGGAYAFAENCYFSHTKDGVDVELRDGAAGIGSAKLLNCKFADDERHLTIGVAPDNYLETTDRSATVNTINNYGGGNGANFDLNSDVFYYKEGRSDVTNMLTAEETKEQVPQLAGVQKRKNGTGGGTIGDGEGDNTGGGDNTGDTGDETAPITKTVNLSGNKAENDVIFDMSDKRGVSIAKVTLNFSATGKGGATLVNADGTTESVSSHIQTGFKSCFLIELADGYVYTVKLYVGSSSGTQSKTISINDTEFSTGIGTNCEELTWALTSGTYSSTESGTVRLARIVITATPLSK